MNKLNSAIVIALMLILPVSASAATVLWYTFEDGTPGTVMNPGTAPAVASADLSGHGYDMWGWASSTQNNSPNFSALGETPQGFGMSARINSGEDGYTTDATINEWSPVTWTIEVSARLDALTSWQTIIGRSGSSLGVSEADFYLQLNDADDCFRVNFGTVGAERVIVDGNFTVTADQWYHLAVVSDGVTVTLYIDQLDGNGYQVAGTHTFTGVGASNALAQGGFVWTFGRGWFGNNTDFVAGYIDDVRFSDVALTPDEFLHTAYDVGFPQPDNGAVNVLRSPTLEWAQVSSAVTVDSYDVYFSTDPNLVDPNQPRTPDYVTAAPSQAIAGPLAYLTTYYWRVDAVAGAETYPGPIWSFTTVPQAPVILTQPADWLIVDPAVNPTVTFTVAAVNADIYKWYKAGDPTVLSTTDSLTIDSTVANEGRYYCEISSSVNPGVLVTTSADRGRFLTQRLVGWWKMENDMLDSVDTIYPEAVTHDGVFVAGTGGVEAYAPGETNNGNGMVFANTGGGTRVAVDAANEDFFDFYTKGFTASIWVQSTLNGWRLPFSKLQTGTGATGWLIGLNTGTNTTAAWIFETRGGLNTSNAVNLRDGNWHMITCLYDDVAKQRRTYVDGTHQTEGSLDLSNYAYLTNTAAVQYGGRETETSISGMVDEARIYSYPLTADEVAELYYQTRGTFCQNRPLYDFDGNCVEDLADLAMMAATWLDCGIYPATACP